MAAEQIKTNIKETLQSFAKGNLTENSIELFKKLGYVTERRAPLHKPTFVEFKDTYIGDKKFDEVKAKISDWKYVDLLFQLSKEEVQKQATLFDTNQVDRTIIETYLFFAIELNHDEYSRTELSVITREVNRLFPMPAMILFKHGKTITISAINRRLHKRDDSKDVLEKVTLIKDIVIENPHRAHIEILFDISFDELRSKHQFTNFVELHNAWQKTLDTKELNKAFYNDLFKWYLWAKDHASFPNDNNEEADKYLSESLIRFISRLLFVWFMKEKKLITNNIFDKQHLQSILKNFDTKSQSNVYYKAILQNLFFATLNVPIDNRKWIDGKKKNKAQLGDPLIYRYESEFVKSDDVIENIFMKIPFLNGGLFDCLDDRENNIFVDGFTKNAKKQPKIPNVLFFGEHSNVDLSHHFADDAKEKNKWKTQSVTGIIDLLHNYKFTIEENTPLEVDVALDPELLGKVFENLLASFNPETKTTARKQTGSFYTPREIVNYMVDESLKQYLITHLPQNQTDIENLFQSNVSKCNEAFKKNSVQKLFECKILDPACGSGAFPMGILHKMVELMTLLDPQNEYLKEIEGRKLDFLIQNAKKLSETSFRNQTIEVLQKQEEILQCAEYDYVRKLYIIENCIYGVDIQPIAIQISKLRFFISLLVEQKKDDKQENYGIQPLPNMDFKLVAANTLIAPPQEDKGIGLFEGQNEFFDQFDQLAHDYFTLYTPEAKKQKKAEITQLINSKVADKVVQINRNKEVAQKADKLEHSVKLWQSYPNIFKEKAVEFFDIPYFFPKVKEGFDVVIGNPPYVQLQKDEGKLAEQFKNEKYSTFERTGDIYSLFYERGYALLKYKGFLTYITSNKWMRASYGKSLRKFFVSANPVLLLDFGQTLIFDNAIVHSNILVLQKASNAKNTITVQFHDEYYKPRISIELYVACHSIIANKLSEEIWAIAETTEVAIKEKFEKVGKPLKNWNITYNYGLKTGYNEAFIVDSKTKDELIAKDSKNRDILKPILRGRDTRRYYCNYANLYMIYLPWHFPLHNEKIVGASNKAEIEFEKKYFSLYQYINQYKDVLQNRNQAETGIRYEWYALQRYGSDYWEEFEKPKIVFSEIVSEPQFYYDTIGYYPEATVFFITGERLKYLTALLNSKAVTYVFKKFYAGGELVGKYRYKKAFLENLPIAIPDNKIEELFNSLVDQILSAKAANPKADTTALEKQIDEMVYKLYELTEEEIAIIEGKIH